MEPVKNIVKGKETCFSICIQHLLQQNNQELCRSNKVEIQNRQKFEAKNDDFNYKPLQQIPPARKAIYQSGSFGEDKIIREKILFIQLKSLSCEEFFRKILKKPHANPSMLIALQVMLSLFVEDIQLEDLLLSDWNLFRKTLNKNNQFWKKILHLKDSFLDSIAENKITLAWNFCQKFLYLNDNTCEETTNLIEFIRILCKLLEIHIHYKPNQIGSEYNFDCLDDGDEIIEYNKQNFNVNFDNLSYYPCIEYEESKTNNTDSNNSSLRSVHFSKIISEAVHNISPQTINEANIDEEEEEPKPLKLTTFPTIYEKPPAILIINNDLTNGKIIKQLLLQAINNIFTYNSLDIFSRYKTQKDVINKIGSLLLKLLELLSKNSIISSLKNIGKNFKIFKFEETISLIKKLPKNLQKKVIYHKDIDFIKNSISCIMASENHKDEKMLQVLAMIQLSIEYNVHVHSKRQKKFIDNEKQIQNKSEWTGLTKNSAMQRISPRNSPINSRNAQFIT